MNTRTLAFVCLCTLFGCTTTSQKPAETPEAVKQLIGDDKRIEKGDWMRATTLDDRIHEFSYQGVAGDDLHGGDTLIPLSQLKKLEIFPLLRTPSAFHSVYILANEQEFRRLIVTEQKDPMERSSLKIGSATLIKGQKPSRTLLLDNDDKASIKSPTLEGNMLTGTVAETSPNLAQLQQMPYKVPIARVVEFGYCGDAPRCAAVRRWPGSVDARLEEIQSGQHIKPGDWVRLDLTGGKVMEFQYKDLEVQRLVGGDGEATLADIRGMTIYPTAVMQVPREQSAGATAVGAVALVGWVLLLMSGIPVPPVVP